MTRRLFGVIGLMVAAVLPATGFAATHAPAAQSTLRSVSAGGWHTCGLETDGAVACWGRNDFGQAAAK